jgi:hypothetical protein
MDMLQCNEICASNPQRPQEVWVTLRGRKIMILPSAGWTMCLEIVRVERRQMQRRTLTF